MGWSDFLSKAEAWIETREDNGSVDKLLNRAEEILSRPIDIAAQDPEKVVGWAGEKAAKLGGTAIQKVKGWFREDDQDDDHNERGARKWEKLLHSRPPRCGP